MTASGVALCEATGARQVHLARTGDQRRCFDLRIAAWVGRYPPSCGCGSCFVSIPSKASFTACPKTARNQPNAFSARWRNCLLSRHRVATQRDAGGADEAITSHNCNLY
jgi:hypothetical protein